MTGSPEAYALAFEEGRRAVASQEELLKETRDRAGMLLSAAAVTVGLATGLSSGAANRIAGLGIAGVLIAALGFIVLTVHAVRIWWPVAVTFNLDSGVLIGSYAEGTPPASLPEMHRELALHLGRHTQANRERIDVRLQWFTRALIGFLIEVLGLLLLLADIAR